MRLVSADLMSSPEKFNDDEDVAHRTHSSNCAGAGAAPLHRSMYDCVSYFERARSSDIGRIVPHTGRSGNGPIEAAEAPLDSGESVRIATVDRVLVVEVEQRAERITVPARPQDHRFSPQLAHRVVHGARLHELLLRGVPQLGARRPLLELLRANR